MEVVRIRDSVSKVHDLFNKEQTILYNTSSIILTKIDVFHQNYNLRFKG